MQGDARIDDEIRTTVDDTGREFIARKHRFPANAAGFLIAPVLWMIDFVAMYSLQGAGCAAGLDDVGGVDLLRVLLGALTVVVAGTIAASGIWSFRAWQRLLSEMEDEQNVLHVRSAFLAYGALLHAGLFLVATLWSGIPILMLESCDPLSVR
ncbi:MAG: hypothetical protein JXB36_20550 [Gammaproteobacteria bacterium]|nr:hypothetical protein [Gammaproteobacteria bacterium]